MKINADTLASHAARGHFHFPIPTEIRIRVPLSTRARSANGPRNARLLAAKLLEQPPAGGTNSRKVQGWGEQIEESFRIIKNALRQTERGRCVGLFVQFSFASFNKGGGGWRAKRFALAKVRRGFSVRALCAVMKCLRKVATP